MASSRHFECVSGLALCRYKGALRVERHRRAIVHGLQAIGLLDIFETTHEIDSIPISQSSGQHGDNNNAKRGREPFFTDSDSDESDDSYFSSQRDLHES